MHEDEQERLQDREGQQEVLRGRAAPWPLPSVYWEEGVPGTNEVPFLIDPCSSGWSGEDPVSGKQTETLAAPNTPSFHSAGRSMAGMLYCWPNRGSSGVADGAGRRLDQRHLGVRLAELDGVVGLLEARQKSAGSWSGSSRANTWYPRYGRSATRDTPGGAGGNTVAESTVSFTDRPTSCT